MFIEIKEIQELRNVRQRNTWKVEGKIGPIMMAESVFALCPETFMDIYEPTACERPHNLHILNTQPSTILTWHLPTTS
jgi:hypothetical protein